MAFLSVTIDPEKLTLTELEARLEPGFGLLPGQLLRMEGPSGPAYGQVAEVQALPAQSGGTAGGYRLRIRLLQGTPTLQRQSAFLLQPAQLGKEVQRLQGEPKQPLHLGSGLLGDFSRLGALTLLGGEDFLLKYELLQLWLTALQPYGKLLIIDPLGIFPERNGLHLLHAGDDARLSVQEVGLGNFLDAFGAAFPPDLRASALRTVAEHLPALSGFLPFSELLDLEGSSQAPLKSLIEQVFAGVVHSRLFAEKKTHSLKLSKALKAGINVLDLSGLREAGLGHPWKKLAYEAIYRLALAEPNVLPVLIYPENYLEAGGDWLQAAGEAHRPVLAFVGANPPPEWENRASTRLTMESPARWRLQGALTSGLPVVLPFKGPPELASAELPALFQPEIPHREAWDATSAEDFPLAYPLPAAISGVSAALIEEDPGLALDAQAEEESIHWLSEFAHHVPSAEPLPVLSEPPFFTEAPVETTANQGVMAVETSFSSFQVDERAEESRVEPDTTDVPVSPSEPGGLSIPSSAERAKWASDIDEAGDLSATEQAFDEALHASLHDWPEDATTEEARDPASPASPPPVIDLSAPLPEPELSFLTPAQLSRLLASSPDIEIPAATQTAPDAPPAEQDSPEAAPAWFNLEAPSDPVTAPQEGRAESALPASPTLFHPPEAPFAPSPIFFPAPEAYTQEDFSFDLALEDKLSASSDEANSLDALAEGLAAAVAQGIQSLSAFPADVEMNAAVLTAGLMPEGEALAEWTAPVDASPVDQPEPSLPEASAALPGPDRLEHSEGAALPESSGPSVIELFSEHEPLLESPVPSASSQEALAVQPVAAAEDPDLQAALDLIFPHGDDDNPPMAFDLSLSTPVPAPVLEEHLPVVPKELEPAAQNGFRVGERVRHPSYGVGVIRKILPTEDSVVLNILFEQVGKRLLDPSLCQLLPEAAL